MVCVPQLGCHEDVFPFHARVERLSEALTNLILVAVHEGAVDVLVADFECMRNCGSDLARIGLPCSKRDLQYHLASVLPRP